MIYVHRLTRTSTPRGLPTGVGVAGRLGDCTAHTDDERERASSLLPQRHGNARRARARASLPFRQRNARPSNRKNDPDGEQHARESLAHLLRSRHGQPASSDVRWISCSHQRAGRHRHRRTGQTRANPDTSGLPRSRSRTRRDIGGTRTRTPGPRSAAMRQARRATQTASRAHVLRSREPGPIISRKRHRRRLCANSMRCSEHHRVWLWRCLRVLPRLCARALDFDKADPV